MIINHISILTTAAANKALHHAVKTKLSKKLNTRYGVKLLRSKKYQSKTKINIAKLYTNWQTINACYMDLTIQFL